MFNLWFYTDNSIVMGFLQYTFILTQCKPKPGLISTISPTYILYEPSANPEQAKFPTWVTLLLKTNQAQTWSVL